MQWLSGPWAVGVVLAGLVAPAVAPAEPVTIWAPPIGGAVIEPFVDGIGAYEIGGHAGVDYAPTPGTAVWAVGDGIVAFAGDVAGATFVVIDHGDGIRTSYGQLADASVRHGEVVSLGQTLGRSGGEGMKDHTAGHLHFGLRVDGKPIDPMLLFEPIDLTQVVRLVPSEDAVPEVASLQAERTQAWTLFGHTPPPEWLMFGQEPSGGFDVGMVVAAVAHGGAALVHGGVAVSPFMRQSLGVVVAAGHGAQDWWSQSDDCSTGTPPAAGFEGTGDHLFVVSGLNSFSRSDGSTNKLAPSVLGYPPDDVSWFSYAPDGGAFTAADTQDGPQVGGARLAAQLRAFAEAHPGRVVDLIGHSQGGVVVEAFLKEHYAGHEEDYPPLGEVITLAAPHRGAPFAALAGDLERIGGVDEFAAAIHQPSPSAGSVQQLAEGSSYLEALAAQPLPSGVDVTTIGAVGDVLVPADQTELAGADHVIVDPVGLWEHGSIVTDAGAMGTVRLVLADQAAPCLGLVEALRNRVQPQVIHSAFTLAPTVLDSVAA